jgi:hypothetical protein
MPEMKNVLDTPEMGTWIDSTDRFCVVELRVVEPGSQSDKDGWRDGSVLVIYGVKPGTMGPSSSYLILV